MWNRIKAFLIRTYGWFGIVLVFIAALAKYVEDFLNYRRSIDTANSRPEGRPQKVDEPDEKGYKQVEVHSAGKDDSLPVGVDPSVKVEVSGTTTEMHKTEPSDGSTQDLIDELGKLIKDNK